MHWLHPRLQCFSSVELHFEHLLDISSPAGGSRPGAPWADGRGTVPNGCSGSDVALTDADPAVSGLELREDSAEAPLAHITSRRPIDDGSKRLPSKLSAAEDANYPKIVRSTSVEGLTAIWMIRPSPTSSRHPVADIQWTPYDI